MQNKNVENNKIENTLNTIIHNNKKYWVEKNKNVFGKTIEILRPETEGLDNMLDSHGKEILTSLRHVDITYGYGSKSFRAVKDLSLNIYKGEVLGLVGESGSGKSTTGKAIVGLVPHSFGQIKMINKVLPKKLNRGFKFGKALKEYKAIEDYMVNKVQMIFQDPANSLNPHKNVEKVVGEGLTNTKNAKEIYLYNFDQEILLKIKKILLDNNLYTNYQMNKIIDSLNKKVVINENAAYKALYEDFYQRLINEFGNDTFLESLYDFKKQRDEKTKLSEKECKRLLVVDLLKSVGLDETVLPRYPLEFSGGQQQRIGITRSVILRPQLLIADEPISALDVSIQAQVVNIFNDLKNKYNLTILFIAHDLRMVEYISDRIAVMNKGTLLEIGTTKEIIENSKHPYTKSLLDAVPSILEEKESLVGYVYDSKMHNYSTNKNQKKSQPIWQEVNKNHYVLATNEEFDKWMKGEY